MAVALEKGISSAVEENAKLRLQLKRQNEFVGFARRSYAKLLREKNHLFVLLVSDFLKLGFAVFTKVKKSSQFKVNRLELATEGEPPRSKAPKNTSLEFIALDRAGMVG